MTNNNEPKIKILKNGPYMVFGNVPMEEKIISSGKDALEYKDGRCFPQAEEYALCRCGRSENMPFCDGKHIAAHFDGTETASKRPYLDDADTLKGPTISLTDNEDLCAFARFCHIGRGSVWQLTMESDDPISKDGAIKAACNCPAGRLVAWDNDTGQPIEPDYPPSIVIIQDPLRSCSGPIWVRGCIPIESSDGICYEVRNRVTLCRCGESENMPFCDATHVSIEFSDKK